MISKELVLLNVFLLLNKAKKLLTIEVKKLIISKIISINLLFTFFIIFQKKNIVWEYNNKKIIEIKKKNYMIILLT